MEVRTLEHDWHEMTLRKVNVMENPAALMGDEPFLVFPIFGEDPKPMIVCRLCGEPVELVFGRACRGDDDG